MARKIAIDGMKVVLSHRNIPDSALQMDFQPVFNSVKRITGGKNFVFLHWQAKPFGLRTWGVASWDVEGKFNYLSSENVTYDQTLQSQLIQIDERVFKIKPTAGVLFTNASTQVVNQSLRIVNAVSGRSTDNRQSNIAPNTGRILDQDKSEHYDRIERAKARAKASRGQL